MEKIRPAVSEICLPQILEPSARQPAVSSTTIQMVNTIQVLVGWGYFLA